MANSAKLPWAILLCKFNDDTNDPTTVKLSDLYIQWLAQNGPNWIADNLIPAVASDPRTILELYNEFFTNAGVNTFNAVKYWDDVSHGSVDVSGSQVFPCTLDIPSTEGAALAQFPGGAQYQDLIFKKAKAALANQHGVDWKTFFGVAVSFQSPDFGSQGGWYDGGPGVYMDIRFVRNNGIQAWGQEMGHGFGMDHSRENGSNEDYRDPWDVMSTRRAFSYPQDPDYGARGPGVNAWNMRGRKWLDESRIWKMPPHGDVNSVVTLRTLHRRDLDGHLGAEIPGVGQDSAYLIEFRVRANWDSGIPNAVVLVHRFEGTIGQFLGSHSYVMTGTNGQWGLSVGDSFTAGPLCRLEVNSIDESNDTATIRVIRLTIPDKKLRPIPWWQWDPEKLRQITKDHSPEEIDGLVQKAEQIVRTLKQISKSKTKGT
jgi:hypothetical protein